MDVIYRIAAQNPANFWDKTGPSYQVRTLVISRQLEPLLLPHVSPSLDPGSLSFEGEKLVCDRQLPETQPSVTSSEMDPCISCMVWVLSIYYPPHACTVPADACSGFFSG